MKQIHKKLIYLFTFLLVVNSVIGQRPPKTIELKLKSIPGVVDVNFMQPDSIYKQAFEIWFEQPIDHNDENSPKFRQKVLLGHVDFEQPVVVEIQGYNVWTDKAGELSKLLNANQLTIEHRFFAQSRPETIPWDKLTIKQAATDQHKIIQKLKKHLYKDVKWVSTGISKGGQTTIYHRHFYPEDVDVSVPYVAPLNLAREDSRIYKFLETVGTDEQREKIYQFQKLCFKNKSELVEKLKSLAKIKEYTWKLGAERIMDYYILEYSFAFWQWGNVPIENIPDENASPKELFEHLIHVTGIDFFEDKGVIESQPFFGAALTEIGIYGYQTAPFKEYFDSEEILTFDFTAPEGTKPKYNKDAMQDVNNWLQENGNNFIYIYGGMDTWGATAVNPGNNTNALKMVLSDGHHGTRIRHFGEKDKEKIYQTLEKWLDLEIKR